MIAVTKADGIKEKKLLAAMRRRASQKSAEVDAVVQGILSDVLQRGFAAVQEHSLRFDGRAPFEIPLSECEAAIRRCDPALVSAMKKAAENIRSYHEKTLVKSWEYERAEGERLGQIVRGLSRVALYVPGGTAAYPSSVLMNAVPAKVAGVSELIVLTPPTQNLSDAVLAAAHIAGVDRVLAVGGAQAIGAAAFGAGFVPRVDKIVGPGNAYVASAKKQVFGQVDIDMIAGPSEVLIIADESANPAWIAADLLSQAEHDPLASATLLTTCEALADRVALEIEAQAKALSRRDVIEQSLLHFGSIVVVNSLPDACALSNEIAPEHLEICTKEPRALLPLIENAGAIFLGEHSPEPLGDYMAGPSHVLPTSGTARFFSPLSVDTFLKKMSVIEYSKQALERARGDIVTMALSESLTAHANSIQLRFLI